MNEKKSEIHNLRLLYGLNSIILLKHYLTNKKKTNLNQLTFVYVDFYPNV